jgi:hypothetical protein
LTDAAPGGAGDRLRPGPKAEVSQLRWIIAALIILLGSLQAWDSNILDAGGTVAVLTSLAILLPALVALRPMTAKLLLATVTISAFLLLAAKRLSPRPLPSLLVIALIGGFMLYGRWHLERRFGWTRAPEQENG